jgi:cytochrome c5
MSERTAILFAAAFAAMTGTAYGAHHLTGEQVVHAQCMTCHESGVNGAPRIGDREAWIPRLSQGVDALVRSAMHGHGAMPARGGMAQLTDRQLREAVIYLFNGHSLETASAAPAGAAPADPYRKVIDGTEIILGVTSAEALRRRNGATATMHGGVPRGSGYYHVNVSLHDAASHGEIRDAVVEARVASALSGETKRLEAMQTNDSTSYGSYFRLAGRDAYIVTVEVLRARQARPIQARFDLRR